MTTMPPPPELADDLLREVFLRLRPDDPACLLHASLACKRWHRILTDPAFRRRHRELHRMPSLVGFLRIAEGDPPYASCFVPNNPASDCPAARDLPGRLVLDCRHGRVLFVAPSPSLGTQLNYDLVVWDPLTNEERCLPRLSPSPTVICGRHFNAAVLCSAPAEGCDHSKCHGGPFRVAFVWSRTCGDLHSFLTSARVYSSETGNWSEPISVLHPNVFVLDRMPCPSTLVGDTLYFRFGFMHALEYQLGAQCLSIILGPPQLVFQSCAISLMSMEDGGLGCMDVEEDESSLRLRLWSRDAASRCDDDAGWTRGRAIELEKLLPDGALPSPRLAYDLRSRVPSIQLLGFVEGTDVIFVGTQAFNHPHAVYMVQFNSGRARKVFDQYTLVIPYTSFFIPGIIYAAKYLLISMCATAC
jgi:hypothetical protein